MSHQTTGSMRCYDLNAGSSASGAVSQWVHVFWMGPTCECGARVKEPVPAAATQTQQDARIIEIRERANRGEYHCREHWGMVEADDDVLFLLEQLDAVRSLWTQGSGAASSTFPAALLAYPVPAAAPQSEPDQGADEDDEDDVTRAFVAGFSGAQELAKILARSDQPQPAVAPLPNASETEAGSDSPVEGLREALAVIHLWSEWIHENEPDITEDLHAAMEAAGMQRGFYVRLKSLADGNQATTEVSAATVGAQRKDPDPLIASPARPEDDQAPYHCQPSDYMAMIVRLQQIEAGELSPRHIDWRTQAGVLWRMLHYATRPTDASVDAFLAGFAVRQAPHEPTL